jgi:hypothetical protein
MKKITSEQIQQLYKFTRAHYVEHFDVQTELVDHLANDIEAIWHKNPNLTFIEARDRSFKKFGVFGFMDVIAERQKTLGKKYWKIIWGFAKDWFKLPKIILTALIFIIFFTISRSVYGEYLIMGVITILCTFLFYKGYLLQKKFKKRFKLLQRKWLLEEMIFTTGMGTSFMLPINLFNILILTDFEQTMIQYTWAAILYAALFTFLVITLYIAVEVLPKKSEELLNEQYPEYKLV